MSNFTFGAPTTTTAPTFGFNTQTQSSGLTLGATAGQPAAAGLNFSAGNPGTTQPQTGLTFGQTTTPGLSLFPTTTAATGTTPALGLNFGTPNKPANTAINFGTPATSAGGLTFGAPATTSNLTFGSTTTSSGLTFGAQAPTTALNFNTATTTTTAAPSFGTGTAGGLSFGTLATSGGLTFGGTSTAQTTGLTFGATATTTTSAPPLFGATTSGLFGTKPPTSTVAITTTTSVTNKGLGGLDVSVTNKGLSQGSSSPTAAKENLLPNELTLLIDSFKECVKSQKSLSSDIARGSSRPLTRCAEDTTSLMEILTTLAGNVQRDRLLVDKLKQDTAKALQNAEIAQRTHDIPAGLQYENTAPLIFFMELADNFEHDLMLFKNQIEVTEKHIQTMVTPKAMTPQELTSAMSKLHESLVAVAGKLQGIHSKVQQQKEQYLNFRKYVLKDTTNVFNDAKISGKLGRSYTRAASGPSPFGPGSRSFLNSSTFNSSQTASYSTPNPLGWGSGSLMGSSSLLMGSSMKPPTAGLNFNPPSNPTAPLSMGDPNSSFQLQKPPIGNKRGKH